MRFLDKILVNAEMLFFFWGGGGIPNDLSFYQLFTDDYMILQYWSLYSVQSFFTVENKMKMQKNEEKIGRKKKIEEVILSKYLLGKLRSYRSSPLEYWLKVVFWT